MKRTLMLAACVSSCFCAAVAMAADPPKKQSHQKHSHQSSSPFKEAVAVLAHTKGNDVSGTILFKQEGDSVRVTGQVKGLTPGQHGFHIHQFGDLRADDGASAGGHYGGSGHKHGGLESTERHAGDLGNIKADDKGVAKVDVVAPDLALHFILGRSIVVHAGADDLKSQPSGNSGPRVAVGVIGVAEQKAPAK
jgi:Cu-Zn family superoxide dismutase